MADSPERLDLSVSVSEEELLAAAKPYFKERGFAQKGKRWTKRTDEYEFLFMTRRTGLFDHYSIHVGVDLIGFEKSPIKDQCHFSDGIPITTTEEILRRADTFFREWTDHELMKRRVLAFLEWDKENPLEKRRAEEVDHGTLPDSTEPLFYTLNLHRDILEYISANYR